MTAKDREVFDSQVIISSPNSHPLRGLLIDERNQHENSRRPVYNRQETIGDVSLTAAEAMACSPYFSQFCDGVDGYFYKQNERTITRISVRELSHIQSAPTPYDMMKYYPFWKNAFDVDVFKGVKIQYWIRNKTTISVSETYTTFSVRNSHPLYRFLYWLIVRFKVSYFHDQRLRPDGWFRVQFPNFEDIGAKSGSLHDVGQRLLDIHLAGEPLPEWGHSLLLHWLVEDRDLRRNSKQ